MWLQAHAHTCPQYSHARVGSPQLMEAVRILLVEYEGGALHNYNGDKLTENKAFPRASVAFRRFVY